MKKLLILLLILSTMATQSQTITYTPSTENFTNPERGWYKYSKAESTTTFSFLSSSTLKGYKNTDKITLVLRIYDLGAFKTTPISQTFLDNIQTDFNTLRTAGVKCVLRFRYTETDAVDATKAIILSHIEQLKPITLANQDVIHVVEAGFIGQYGEWYYTTNFGNKGVLTTQNIADRKEVGLKIMELAPTRMVMFRTPYFQQMIGGTTPISNTTAYNGSVNSRIGLHNDAFLSSNSDSGTYKSTSTEYPYLDVQSKYTFCGGESNALFPAKQDCSVVFSWLTRFHYNYLNFGYHPDVITLWQTGGCYNEIARRLGYRFELVSSTITDGVLTINIKNVGFANIFNQRKVILIAKNTNTNTQFSFEFNTDIRKWNAGETIQITQDLVNNLGEGEYSLFLNLPDNNGNILHSIQLANTGVWDATKGINNLNLTYTKGNVAQPPLTVSIFLQGTTIIVNNLTNYTIAVYNMKGQLVRTTNDLTGVRRGYYIIKVTNVNGVVYTQKIYKK